MAIVCGLLVVPAASQATVTCSAGSTVPTVDLGANLDGVFLSVSGTTIQVHSNGSNVPCDGGTPTVNNTAAISIVNHSGFSANFVTIENAGAFVPGVTSGPDENGGTPEIEIFVNLNDAPNALLSVRSAGGSVRFGDSGINYNATGSEVVPDWDIRPIGVAKLEGRNGTPQNTLPSVFGAQGGAGTGGPLFSNVDLLGNNGPDLITGGEGNDRLQSFGGSDGISGGGGNDTLEPGLGSDVVDGGSGIDLLDYRFTNVPDIAIDLDIAGPQNGAGGGTETIAGIEDVDGTVGGDVIRGDAGPNRIITVAGNDVIEGRGGVDIINSGISVNVSNDVDSVDVRDGGPDTVDCGVGIDSVTADEPGVDTLTDCEDVSFATPAGGGGTGGGGTGGGGTTSITFGLDTLVTLKLAARRIPAKGPLKVRVTNRNAFAITGTLAARTVRKVRVGSGRRRVRLPARAIGVAAHSGKTIRMRLPRVLRRILRRRGQLLLQLTARVTDPVGNSRTIRKRVRPRLKR
jgi:Ca2+-binding RTX toxin-like protein